MATKRKGKGAASTAPDLHVLVDADSICYAAGFAAQHEFYLCTYEGASGLERVAEGKSKTELVENVKAHSRDDWNDPAKFQTWHRREVEPVANACHSVKLQLERAMKCIREKAPGRVVTGPSVYLTGSGNFREQIATIRPYKGNRDPAAKPVLLNELREYLVRHWEAQVIGGKEADDEVAIVQTWYRANNGPNSSIIVGIDKDLMQIPGLHYNPSIDKFANISEAMGDCLFYRQLLIGDTSDNVKGCHKIGEKKAADVIKSSMSCEEMASICLDLYTQSIAKHGDVYNGLSAEAALLETGRLLWLRRDVGDEWYIGKGARNPTDEAFAR